MTRPRLVTGARLQYDDVPIGNVEPDITPALAAFIREAQGKPKRIFCTYTAMLALRGIAASRGLVRQYWEAAA